jgi:hypothetical protein
MVNVKKSALFGFAAASFANGVYRYFSSQSEGRTGLIFGCVMAAMALAGALLLRTRVRLLSWLLGLSSIVMTGGFFFFAMMKRSGNYGVTRPLIMVLVSLLALILFVLPLKGDAPPERAEESSER